MLLKQQNDDFVLSLNTEKIKTKQLLEKQQKQFDILLSSEKKKYDDQLNKLQIEYGEKYSKKIVEQKEEFEKAIHDLRENYKKVLNSKELMLANVDIEENKQDIELRDIIKKLKDELIILDKLKELYINEGKSISEINTKIEELKGKIRTLNSAL